VLSHPASRILSLALLTIWLADLDWVGLLVVLLPLAWLLHRHPVHGSAVTRTAWRLRWFFLSILVVYLWFTPGVPLLSPLGGWSPTVEGLQLGGQRVLGLLTVIGYSVFLLRLTARDELIAGLDQLLAPLSRVGFDADRLALRLGLVLDLVPRLEATQRRQLQGAGRDGLIVRAAAAFRQAETGEFDPRPTTRVSLPELSRWRLVDWLVPTALLLVILAGRWT